MMVMIIIPSTIISQCDDGDDVNLSTIINHSLAEYLQPAKQMIQFGASHCGKAKTQVVVGFAPPEVHSVNDLCFFGGKYFQGSKV